MPLATLHASAADHRDTAASAVFEQQRQAMIDSQLRTSAVTAPALIRAIAAIRREDFVPAARRPAAYADRTIALEDGRGLNPPLTTARLIAEAAVHAGDRVLLIGAATGFAAAILAHMGAVVTAVESSPALAATARGLLAETGGVEIVEGPLGGGAPGHAAFDVLIVDGAVPGALPSALMAQLRDGARIVAGVADGPVTRLARAVHVAAVPTVALLPFVDLECVALPGFAAPKSFSF